MAIPESVTNLDSGLRGGALPCARSGESDCSFLLIFVEKICKKVHNEGLIFKDSANPLLSMTRRPSGRPRPRLRRCARSRRRAVGTAAGPQETGGGTCCGSPRKSRQAP